MGSGPLRSRQTCGQSLAFAHWGSQDLPVSDTRDTRPALPAIASADEWRSALDELLEQEKAHTRRGDAIAAARRRLPMVEVRADHRLRSATGDVPLLDMFENRRQLIVYHFMFGTEWEAGCDGCSWVADAMSHPAHLNARDVSLALVSRAPIDKLLAYRKRMGWTIPWYSAADSDFNETMGATVEGIEQGGLSVFVRHGHQVFRSYFTTGRGIEHLGSHWAYLDLTPFGRQETWEDSPPGWPQGEPYLWQRRHDEYPS